MSTFLLGKCVFSVPPQTWKKFGEHLLAMRNQRDEAIGFFFCTRHSLPSGACRLLPRTWIVPSRECYEVQSVARLELRQDFHQYLVDTYLRKGLDVVHIHTHPGLCPPRFSGVDDLYEAEYARFLGRLPGQPLLVSGVFNERLEHGRFRLWKAGAQRPSDEVVFSTSWMGSSGQEEQSSEEQARFDRQRVFGAGVQEALGRMTVGLVGCGGLGAVFAEQLSRLGVRSWVLVDPDHLDDTNLNRMPFATPAMANRACPKVRYVTRLIKRAWPTASSVRCLKVNVNKPHVEHALAACDLLVVATDNHMSRMIVQGIALRYMRPLLSLGTLIEARDGQDGLRFYCRVTHPPLHGGWCLMCAGVIDPLIAATESAPPEVAMMVREAGYVANVAAPAVYWLNSVCASVGVQVIHGAMSGFLDVSAGLDWAVELREGHWFHLSHDPFPDCLHCSADGEWAAGPRNLRKRGRGTQTPSGQSQR